MNLRRTKPARSSVSSTSTGRLREHTAYPSDLSLDLLSYFRSDHSIILTTLDDLKGEKFADTKKRLQARIGVSDKDFAKYKFALIQVAAFKQPSYIEDGECLYAPCIHVLSDSGRRRHYL
jgi:hypothetical protein